LNLTEEQVKRLLEYEGKIEIKQFILSLAITTNRMKYEKDNSPSCLSTIVKDLNAVIDKYKSSVYQDYMSITSI